eukprot:g5239.t1
MSLGNSPRINYGDVHSRGLLSYRTTEEQILHEPSSPRGENNPSQKQKTTEVKGNIFALPSEITLANEDYESRIVPVCECDLLHRSTGVTNVKIPLYIRVLNAQDLYIPVKCTDFELSVRAGPGNPVFEIEELAASRLFKLSLIIGTSGTYNIGLLCRRIRIKQTPFEIEVVRAITSSKYSTVRGEGSKTTVAGKQSLFEIVSRDQNGNRRRKGGDHIRVTFAGSEKVELKSITDIGDGIYTVSYQAVHSGWYTIIITINRQQIDKGPQMLFVYPAEISSCTTALVTQIKTVEAVAGYKASIQIQAKDRFGNNLSEGGAVLTGYLLCSTNSSHKIQLTFQDLKNGIYEGSFVGDIKGLYEPRVFLHCRESKIEKCKLCSSVEIEISHGDVCSSECIIEVINCESQVGAWDDVKHKTIAGEWNSYILYTYDAFQNRCNTGGEIVTCLVGIDQLSEQLVNDHLNKWKTEQDAIDIILSQIETHVVDQSKNSINNVIYHKGYYRSMISVIIMVAVEDGSYLISWKSSYASKYWTKVLVSSQQVKDLEQYSEIIPSHSSPQHSWIDGKARAVCKETLFLCQVGGRGGGMLETLRGVVTTFQVLAADCFGNRRLTGGDCVQVDVAGPTYYTADVVDNHNGTYTVCYSPKAPGRYSLHVIMNGEAVGRRSYGVRVRDAITKSGCYCIAGALKQIVAHQELALRLHPLNKSNVPLLVTKQKFRIHLELHTETTLKAEWFADHTPDMSLEEINNLVNSTVECTAPQDPFYEQSGLDNITSSLATNLMWKKFKYQFQKDYIESIRSKIISSDGFTIQKSYKVEIETSLEGDLVARWIPEHAGTYTWQVSCDGVDVSPDNEQLIVNPNQSIDISQSVIYGYGAKYAIAGQNSYFIFQACDLSGNLMNVGGEEISIYFCLLHPSTKSPSSIANSDVQTNVSDLRDGRYLVCYSGTVVGQYSVQVFAKNSKMKKTCTITMHPAASCGQNFKVLSEKSLQGVVGKWEEFKVQSVDAFGNNRSFGGDIIFAAITNSASSTQASKIFVDNKDLNDGSYTISYYATRAGAYTLNCYWKPKRGCVEGEQSVCFYSETLMLQPGPVSPQTSILDTSGVASCETSCVSSIKIQIRDQFGNPRDLEALPYEIKISDKNTFKRNIPATLNHNTRFETSGNTLVATLYRITKEGRFPGGMITVDKLKTKCPCITNDKDRTGSFHAKKMNESSEINAGIYSFFFRVLEEGKYEITLELNEESIRGNVLEGNDIALCELDGVSAGSIPDLVSSGDAFGRLDLFSVLGWGTAKSGSPLADVLQIGSGLRFVPDSVCNREKDWTGRITRSMICAGFNDPSTCKGDSGGPLLIPDKLQGSIELGDSTVDPIVGITSFGDRTCDLSVPGVYTRVSCYRPWISCIMEGKAQACDVHTPCQDDPSLCAGIPRIANLNETNALNRIETALQSDDSETVKEIICQGLSPNELIVGSRNSLLIRAAQLDAVKSAEVLLKQGADLRYKNSFGQTALSRAAGYGSVRVTQARFDNTYNL